ncbi:MAG TPA: HAD hydrolase family protein [Chitinophagaceae bacterium]|nr:HAD hydrolase family protein [Chitinophagaceae bacterium]
MLDQFNHIKGFIFDIDGVLTDGQIYVVEGQIPFRAMNIKDGYALQHAVKKGYPIIVISGGNSEAAKIRLERLGIEEVFISIQNKVELLEGLAKMNAWDLSEFVYMGDDIPDLEAMQVCGYRACPKDAVEEIKAVATFISTKDGGKGCVRELIEKVLKVQGNWLP